MGSRAAARGRRHRRGWLEDGHDVDANALRAPRAWAEIAAPARGAVSLAGWRRGEPQRGLSRGVQRAALATRDQDPYPAPCAEVSRGVLLRHLRTGPARRVPLRA